MWISVFDIVRDVDPFEKEYPNSSFHEAMKSYGEMDFSVKSGITSSFIWKKGEDDLVLSFHANLKEKMMEVFIRGTIPANVSILITEFRKWIFSLGIDCLLYFQESINPLKKEETLESNQGFYTFTGEKSKKLIDLMNQLPLAYPLNDKSKQWVLKLDHLFRGVQFAAEFHLYAEPWVDIYYIPNEYMYHVQEKDMFTWKRCTSVKDIMNFLFWFEGMKQENKQMITELKENIESFYPDVELENDTLYLGEHMQLSVSPTLNHFELQYEAWGYQTEEVLFHSKEEVIQFLVNDAKRYLELKHAQNELISFAETHGFVHPFISKNENQLTVNGELYGKSFKWSLGYSYDHYKNLAVISKFSEPAFHHSIEAGKEKLKKNLFDYIKNNRLRELFKDKQK